MDWFIHQDSGDDNDGATTTTTTTVAVSMLDMLFNNDDNDNNDDGIGREVDPRLLDSELAAAFEESAADEIATGAGPSDTTSTAVQQSLFAAPSSRTAISVSITTASSMSSGGGGKRGTKRSAAAAAASKGMAKARKVHAQKDKPKTARSRVLSNAEATAALQESLESASRLVGHGPIGTGGKKKGKKASTGTSSSTAAAAASKMAQLKQRFSNQKRQNEETTLLHLRSLIGQHQNRRRAGSGEASSLDMSGLAGVTASSSANNNKATNPALAALDIPLSTADIPRYAGEPFAVAALRIRMEQAAAARQLLERHKAMREAVACIAPTAEAERSASTAVVTNGVKGTAEVVQILRGHMDEAERAARRMCALSAHMQAYCDERSRLLLQHVMLARPSWSIQTGVVASIQAPPVPHTAAAAALAAPTPQPLGSFSAVRAVPPLAAIDTVNAKALFDPGFKTHMATPQALSRR